ncbi:MAG: zinc ribbon domain-containing protein, partial [Planctomycetes bacterium]|nr:zinc ribbon domain-containing protein [Planctomycetota bacterium]
MNLLPTLWTGLPPFAAATGDTQQPGGNPPPVDVTGQIVMLLLTMGVVLAILWFATVLVIRILRKRQREHTDEKRGSAMRTVGLLLIGVGLIWGGIAVNMETTVTHVQTHKYIPGLGDVPIEDYHDYPISRVHNLDLADRRRTHLLLAALTFIAGVGLFGFGTVSRSIASRTVKAEEGSTVKCPFCAESIRPEAVICRFCGREVRSPAQRDGLEQAASSTGVCVTCPGCGVNLRL